MLARSAWAALALAVVSPSLALGQAPSREAAELRAAQRWLAQTAAFTSAYQGAFADEERALGAIIAGVPTAMGFFSRYQTKEGAAWAADWAKARRVDLANIQAEEDALPKSPPPLPPSIAELGLRQVERTVRDMQAAEIEQSRAGLQLGEELVGLVEKTASGDAEAATLLNGRRFEVVIVTLRGENALMRASNEAASSGDPGADLIRSITETNLATIDLMLVLKSRTLKDGQDTGPLVADMRSHALAGAAAAQRIALDSAGALKELRADRSLSGTPLVGRLEKAEATYPESAQIEEAIAAAMTTVADALAKGQDVSSGAAADAIGQLDPLVQKRLELDQRRKQIIAGQDQ